MPLSFEPNVGQNESVARFTARGTGYTLQLEAARALLRFAGPKASEGSKTVTMEMVEGNRTPEVTGEDALLGKANYFPTKDPKTWFSNIPTYSRVKYSAVYPGIDLAYYGNANRLEFDFMLLPKADPGQIRMKLTGSDEARIDKDGNLVLRVGKDDIRFLVPVAYQTSADDKRRDTVSASYRLEKAANGEPAMVSFALGSYDRTRPLVIDPVVLAPALSYAQYVNGYAADVTVDASGNTYVTGQNTTGSGFYVTEFNSAGTVVYNTTIGTSTIYPFRVRVDSTGAAYVAGYTYLAATLPTGPNSYKSTVTGGYNAFLVKIASGGASVPYATFMGGTDSSQSGALGLGVQNIGGVQTAFISGWTYSTTFPTTAGVYQSAHSGSSGNYNGWVASFNPAASGSASLIYSTLLGTANSQLFALAADSSGNAYVTGNASSSTFPVTTGAFQYSGYDSTSGGIYVTKLNPTGTALGYSAYLGYGTAYGIAVDGQATPNVYVTGTVGYADFPTTTGAYQTTYAGGFVTKLSSDGSSEVYSTFLGGPSSYNGSTTVVPYSLALENGCASACNAYVSGYTSTADFPAVNAIQTAESTSAASAFVVELAANGGSALFSSYLSGLAGNVEDGALSSVSYGVTPAIAVDSSGNMSVAGNLGGAADFPVTITNANPDYAFLAKIGSSSSPFTWSTPTSISFASQPVGVSTSLYGTPATVSIRNLSATPVTISSIVASPSIFSESDSCAGAIPAAGLCTMTLNFQPAVTGVRTGTLTVNTNASNSPTVVALTGTGYDTAFIQTSVTGLTFGAQTVATSSAPQSVTLTNTGDETALLNVYANSGVDFSVVNNCSSPLAPGGTCVAEVTFTPTQAGLRTDTLYVTGGGPTRSLSLSGTGLAAGAAGIVGFTATALDFGSLTVGSTTTYQGVYIENLGSVPFTVTAITASGDFSIYSSGCGALPFQLNPQSSCIVYTTFTPSAVGLRTGNLTFTDTATGSPHSVALSGTGLAGVQTLEFYPSPGANFGVNVPVGIPTAAITVYAQNAGTSPITIDRVLISGDFYISSTNCPTITLAGTTTDGTGTLSSCYVNVNFKPTATGLRTGTLTFIDSASNSPQTVPLSGNAIADTGTAAATPTQLDFATQATGTTSATQSVIIANPGDTNITINSYATGTGNFSTSNWYCSAVPFTLTPGASCGIYVQFTPASAGPLTDTLTITGSVGSATVALSGTGVTGARTIGFTPASPMNSGSVVVGQSSGANGDSGGQSGDLVSIRNAGTAAVTFSASPAIGGTNAADFTLYNPNSCGNNTTQLQPGASCPMWIRFAPSSAIAETATLTFTDNATGGTQVMTLNGTGIASAPTYYLSNNLLNFDNQVEGTTSPLNTYVRFYNNSGASVTLGNAVLSSGFIIPGGNQTCNGAVVSTASSCLVYVSFAPTSTSLITGTITFKNSGSVTLASAPLTGYAPAPALSAILTPSTLNFDATQVVGTTSAGQTTVLTNTGNLPLTVGTVIGVNLGATPTKEFLNYSDGCTGVTLNPGGTCTEYVDFTPNAAGARTGSLTIPVTYTGGSTASFTTNFTGTGTAEVNSAMIQAGTGSFVDQAVGVVTPYVVTFYLVNRGDLPFHVGTVTGVNTIVGVSTPGEFAATYDGCSGATVAANGSCQMNVTLTPSATGTRTGSMGFPVTFADTTTTTVTENLSGIGVAAAPTLQFQPASLNFLPEIVSNTSAQSYIAVKNIGNKTVHFSSMASPSAGFVLGGSGDGCFALSLNNLGVGQTCYIYVSFAPTTTGNITGTLTVNDNATGGPHSLALAGTGILASQQIAISQTALTFGNQPQGSISSPQLVYVTNQSDTTVTSLGAVLGGTNSADYQLTNNCSTSLGARAICSLSIKFAPAVSATGTRTASITLSDSDTGSPRTITLSGTAIVPGPAVALAPPSPLTFATQNVGTTSGTENFSVTNTGSASLTVSNVALSGTNAAEFSIVSNGCSGAVLTPSQNCIVGIRFSPALGGTRTAIASVTDTATGSPQTIALSGFGYGIPSANLSSAILTYASTNVGVTTAAQSVTLSNPGTDTLNIAGINLTGPNTGDFTTLVTTCLATLAPGANCTISTKFAPIATGTRTAAITITDNANNIPGSTESVTVTGTGLINSSTTAATLTSGTNPSTYGASLTFKATVTTGATGSVSFYNMSSGANCTGLGSSIQIGSTQTLSGGSASVTTTTLAAGSDTILACYSGDGNYSGSSGTVPQTVNKANSTTGVTLTAGANPSTFGASLTFKATVTGTGATGSVSFYNQASGATCAVLGASIGIGSTQTLSGGSASVTTTTTLGGGADTILACYSGDGNYTSSSGTVSQTVNKANSTTAVTLMAGTNPSTFGASLTFKATVTSGVTGSVSFYNQASGATCAALGASTQIGRTQTLSGNSASVTTTTLPGGSDVVLACYSGDSNYNSNQGSIAQTVNLHNSSTALTLTAGTNPSTYGASLTFTATVTMGATGTVSFYHMSSGATCAALGTSTQIGSQTLSGSLGSITTTLGSVGYYTILACYSGDGNYNSSSGQLAHILNKASTTTGVTLTAGTNPSTFGTSLTFTAAVTAGATGSVTFYNEASGATCAALGASIKIGNTQTLSSGSASVITTTLGGGADTILACYYGDANYTTSSGTVSQTVNPASSTTNVTLTSGTNPSTSGASLTFKATVTGTGATGSVSFYNQASGATCAALGSSTQIGSTQTLSGSSASVTTTTLPTGADTILACYGGSSNYTSSSGTVSQTVNP